MTPAYAHQYILPAALALLPPRMDSREARAMLLAVGLQESKLKWRQQVRGPALGYWQFEPTGFAGVMQHRATKEHAIDVCSALDYATYPSRQFQGLADNDILACAFARLLLWTLPGPLPGREERDKGWTQYLDAWRPGRPRPETWLGCWEMAWRAVEG